MEFYLSILKKLKSAQKQQNDIMLISEYFQGKFSLIKNFDLMTVSLSSKEEQEIITFVDKYCQSDYPIQYFVGFELFGGLKIKVNQDVLIPRMETEEVVWELVYEIRKTFPKGSLITIADICTGSGCIVVLLDYLLKDDYKVKFYATDISGAALDVALENFKKYQIECEIYEGNLIDPLIQAKIKTDIIISNPPYIPFNDEVQENVRKYEPNIALFAEGYGLAMYDQILEKCNLILNEKKIVCFEIGYNQGDLVYKRALKLKFAKDIVIIKDMNKNERIFIMR